MTFGLSDLRTIVVGLSLGSVVLAAAQVPRYWLADDFLRTGLQFSSSDLDAVDRGSTAVRSVASHDDHSVTVAGLVRLNATPEVFVERLRDIEHFKSDAAVLQIGRFSPTPRVEDIERLSWEPDDLGAMRKCQIADCDLRLTADAIGRFRADVDWSSPDRDQQASRLATRLLVETSTAYLQRGAAALQDFRDRERPVSPRLEFETLVAESPSPLDLAPEFREYLLAFPGRRLDGVESFLYWSKETVAFHAVVSVTHVAVYTPPARSPFLVIVGTRQVYASRYFDASLGMTVMFETTSSAHPVAPFEFLYVNRSRTDELTGFWGGLKGPIVRSRARAALHKYLALLKTRLERDVIAQAPDGPIP